MGRTKLTVLLLIVIVSTLFAGGCTDWKKKYNALYVEHENLQGLLEREKSEKGQLAEQIAQDQKTIEELQRQIAERQQSAAEATGFGKGYDVKFDPSAGTITVTLENKILFSPGKASLKSQTISQLNHIVSVIKSKYPGKLVDVIGHTDSDPIRRSKWADNWELSAQRALSVARYLIKQGISEDKIRAVGRGSTMPVASNSTASGKSRNRRVEIVVHIRSS